MSEVPDGVLTEEQVRALEEVKRKRELEAKGEELEHFPLPDLTNIPTPHPLREKLGLTFEDKVMWAGIAVGVVIGTGLGIASLNLNGIYTIDLAFAGYALRQIVTGFLVGLGGGAIVGVPAAHLTGAIRERFIRSKS